MAELTVLLLGLCAIFFVLYELKPEGAEPGQAGHQRNLEDTFVELKERALIADVRDDEDAYRRLLHRVDSVVEQILERHVQFVLDVEIRHADIRRELGGAGFDAAALRQINLESVDPEILLYLCFFLYVGGRARDFGWVESDPESMLRILRYLVGERAYPPGQFFLGLVMKYGARADLPADLGQARRLLQLARENGVGAATIELRQLSKHKALRRVKGARLMATPVVEQPSV